MKRVILVSMLMLACGDIAQAQWECLPLYGGHADRLVQNKYKPNEIFAIVKKGGIYKSTDYGETWETVVADVMMAGWGGTEAFEVAANDEYFVYADRQIFRSTDEGKTWRVDSSLSNGRINTRGVLEAHRDSTLFFLPSGERMLFISKNNGKNWDTLTFKSTYDYRIEKLFLNPNDSKNIFLYGLRGEYRWTRDGGRRWNKSPFPETIGEMFGMNSRLRNQTLVLGIWSDTPLGAESKRQYDYYESNDTGFTWIKVNINPLIINQGVVYESKKTILDQSGIYLMSTYNILFRSSDSGKTQNIVADVSIWDMIRSKLVTLGSMTFEGLQKSTDLGATWHTFKGTRKFPGFRTIDFEALSPDIMFAQISDWSYNAPSVAEFMQSNDGGLTWITLLRGTSFSFPRTSNEAEPRYFVIENNNTLVSGRPGQTTPDTLLVGVGEIVQLEIADAFPSDMYVVVKDAGRFGYFTSTDYGKNWTRWGSPPYRYYVFKIIPSRVERGRFLVVTLPENPLDFLGMGLWLVKKYGRNWNLQWQSDYLSGNNIHVLNNDLLYFGWERTFSKDYGKTWFVDTTGMEAGDWRRLHDGYGYKHFTCNGKLIVATNSLWYEYNGMRWTKLRDAFGKPISRTSPATLDIVGNYLYCGYPYVGLYRIRSSNITGVGRLTPAPVQALLDCYPNPFSDNITISYRYGSVHSAQLKIINTLGQVVYSRDLAENSGTIRWDGKTSGGTSLPNGIYLAVIISGGRPAQSRFILHIK